MLPLGSGALAGSPYPLDRESVAKELEFEGITENSMDAVSDRDFVLDYLYAASTCMAHLSRLGEEFVLWSSEEFGFLLLGLFNCTGNEFRGNGVNDPVDLDLKDFALHCGGGEQDDQKKNLLLNIFLKINY